MSQAQKANRKLKTLAAQAENAADPAGFFLKAMSRTLDNDKTYCLALDDFQKIDNPDILAALPLVVGRMPANFTLFILSRQSAPEPFASLIAKDRVGFVSAADLRFDAQDVRDLALLRGAQVTMEMAREIYDHTGGWALGVTARLAALAVDGGTDDAGFHGRADYFSHYLENYIWANWLPEVRDLLLRTSLATDLEPEFCNHLTGRKDCGTLLQTLCAENPFIARMEKDSYRLHDLFRDWLAEKWARDGDPDERRETHLRAARWFHGKERYLQAVDLYAAAGEYAGVVQARLDMSRYDVDFSVENHIRIMRSLEEHHLSEAFIDASPELISLFAWGNWLLGNADKYCRYADRLREKLANPGPGGIQKPATKFFLLSLDFRVPLAEFAKKLLAVMPPRSGQVDATRATQVASITQNQPLMHRSMRDFSDMLAAGEEGDVLLRATFGSFIGPDYRVAELCYRAGLLYEQGEAEAARRTLDRAGGGDSLPEFHTCAQTLACLLLLDAGERAEAEAVAAALEEYLEDHNASFLWPNVRALLYSRAIAAGDTEKAREWLSLYAAPEGAVPMLHSLPRHFATVRALLASGHFQRGLTLANALGRMAGEYARPLDSIEADILRCLALWRLGRPGEALKALGTAESLARQYGYVRLFRQEGEALAPPLRLLAQKRKSDAASLAFIAQLFSPDETALPLKPPAAAPEFGARQLELLRLLEKGLTTQHIAAESGISPNTVKHHLNRIYRALGVTSREEAVRVAKGLGVLKNMG